MFCFVFNMVGIKFIYSEFMGQMPEIPYPLGFLTITKNETEKEQTKNNMEIKVGYIVPYHLAFCKSVSNNNFK